MFNKAKNDNKIKCSDRSTVVDSKKLGRVKLEELAGWELSKVSGGLRKLSDQCTETGDSGAMGCPG